MRATHYCAMIMVSAIATSAMAQCGGSRLPSACHGTKDIVATAASAGSFKTLTAALKAGGRKVTHVSRTLPQLQ